MALRLRPGSQPLSRFIVAANLWAVAAGAVMVAAGLIGLTSGMPPPAGLLDAAYHAIALGLVTILIVGMAQLIMPVFAIQRASTAASPPSAGWLVFTALMFAAALRAVEGAGIDTFPQTILAALIAVSGCLAWVGLAAFAVGMTRSWLRQGRLKAQLASTAIRKTEHGP
jgi:hypothetical protein